MLALAVVLCLAWIVALPFVVGSVGFVGPVFWSTQLVLILGLFAAGMHLRKQRRRVNLPDGYSSAEMFLLMGFTLLLVGGTGTLVAVDGYRAGQSSRLKRTEANIRSIAAAWEGRATDMNQYNAGGAVVVPAGPLGDQSRTFPYVFGREALEPLLVPTYMRVFPATDGWGNAWQFATDQPFPRGNGAPAQMYMIRSAGGNGKLDPIVAGRATSYDCDIVYTNGQFISW